MRINVDTDNLGPLWISVPDDKVLAYVEAFGILGFEHEVVMED